MTKIKSRGRRSTGKRGSGGGGAYMPYGAPYGGPRPLNAPPMPLHALPLAPLSGPPVAATLSGMFMAEYGIRPPPFDRYLCDDVFPLPTDDVSVLNQQLLNRHEQIVPSAAEQTAVQNLVTKIDQILEKIVSNPDSFTPVVIEEVREIGSFKTGTILANHNVADLVVILKSLPTVESVNALGQKIVNDLKEENNEIYGCVAREFGCEIAGTQAVVRIFVTIVPQNASLLEPDLHLPEKILQRNLATVRHVRWFEEHATHSSVKVLVRLLKDVKKRFDGFKALSTWSIMLLSHYCIMHTRVRTPLPLATAFRRFFHVLSTGMLLPTSSALIDPCEPATRINYALSYEDMDTICSTAQTLYRVILHGGSDQVVGMAQKPINVANELTVWNDVIVTPLEKAYSAGDMEPFYTTFSDAGTTTAAATSVTTTVVSAQA